MLTTHGGSMLIEIVPESECRMYDYVRLYVGEFYQFATKEVVGIQWKGRAHILLETGRGCHVSASVEFLIINLKKNI